MCICYSQTPNLSLLPPFHFGNHKFVFYVCGSISVLYISSFVSPFLASTYKRYHCFLSARLNLLHSFSSFLVSYMCEYTCRISSESLPPFQALLLPCFYGTELTDFPPVSITTPSRDTAWRLLMTIELGGSRHARDPERERTKVYFLFIYKCSFLKAITKCPPIRVWKTATQRWCVKLLEMSFQGSEAWTGEGRCPFCAWAHVFLTSSNQEP